MVLCPVQPDLSAVSLAERILRARAFSVSGKFFPPVKCLTGTGENYIR